MEQTWTVILTKKASKQKKKLPQKYQDMVTALEVDLQNDGPIQTDWPNFSALDRKKTRYHCHLNKKGHPTYVAVWDVLDYKVKLVEIRYIGTRENAPYN